MLATKRKLFLTFSKNPIQNILMRTFIKRQDQPTVKHKISWRTSIKQNANRIISGLLGGALLICLVPTPTGMTMRHWTAIELGIQGFLIYKLYIIFIHNFWYINYIYYNAEFWIRSNFSICEEPTEIDARVISTNNKKALFDWVGSDSILIHHSGNDSKPWNIGISTKG